jgi:O-methyltransferase involved in polyketide biosynthesis
MFDETVRDFNGQHQAGTVVQLGAGLNTRFERLDNGRISWVDVDLPDVAELRSHYFADTPRRITVGASVLDPSWISRAAERPAPYFLVAEAVFLYLAEADVKRALALIAGGFPGSRIAFDTGSQRMIDDQRTRDVMSRMTARMRWACSDPIVIAGWDLGLTLVDTRTFFDAPARFKAYQPLSLRWLAPVFFRRQIEAYRLNLFQTAGADRVRPFVADGH